MAQTLRLVCLSLAAAVAVGSLSAAPSGAAEEHEHRDRGRMVDGRGHVLDDRYNHGHFYPAVGASVRVLPEGYRPYFFGGRSFYFSAGIWYAPGPAGFVVVRPPVGVVISVLPPYYSTVWIGGIPYYYANEVYYTWSPGQNGYVVVDPPAHAGQPSAPPDVAREDLMIYPKNGQTSEQQAADRYDCHSWARTQTGFDPTQPGGAAPGGVAPAGAAPAGVPPGGAPGASGGRSAYDRAMSACLTARGYQVN